MKFVTHINNEADGELQIRGKNYMDMLRSMTYVQGLYFLLTGREPTKGQERLFNALLLACLDHGIKPATGFVPMVVAASGNEMTHALAAGVLAIGPYHGGAVDHAAQMYYEYAHNGSSSISGIVHQMRAQRKRVPGYGHRFYRDNDPRAEFLLELAKQEGYSNDYIAIAREFERAIEQELGSKKILNVDGAAAAVLLEIGLPPDSGNGLFALARMGGMIAHVLEEMRSGAVVRRLDDSEVEYAGQ